METSTSQAMQVVDPQEVALPIVRPGMTLWEIMDVLERMEKGLLELTPDDMSKMGAIARSKVDGYKQFIDMAGGVSEMIGRWEDELAQARKSVDAKVAGLTEHMRKMMVAQGFEKLPGHIYEARIQKNPPKLVMNPAFSKPDSDLYRKFPDCSRRAYSWDADAEKKAIQAGSQEFVEFCVVEQGTKVKFGVNKDIN